MKLDKAITLKEETVKKCLAYFSKIYGSPTDMRQAANRKSAAEHEAGVSDGDDYYENSNKTAFFNDLNKAVGQIQKPEVKAKFADYIRAYIKNAPEDGYKCNVTGNLKNKVAEANYIAKNNTHVFNSRTGDYTPRGEELVK